MRRFILTSPNIKGSVEIVYNDNGLVTTVDFSPTEPTYVSVRKALLERLARFPQLQDIEQIIAGTQGSITESDFEVTFEMFWNKYDKKINKARAIKLWEKLSKTDQVKAYYGIAAYDKYLHRESWRTKADPETYLRNRYWENEYK